MKYKSTLLLDHTHYINTQTHSQYTFYFDVIRRKMGGEKEERFMLLFYHNLNSCENENREK